MSVWPVALAPSVCKFVGHGSGPLRVSCTMHGKNAPWKGSALPHGRVQDVRRGGIPRRAVVQQDNSGAGCIETPVRQRLANNDGQLLILDVAGDKSAGGSKNTLFPGEPVRRIQINDNGPRAASRGWGTFAGGDASGVFNRAAAATMPATTPQKARGTFHPVAFCLLSICHSGPARFHSSVLRRTGFISYLCSKRQEH